MSVVLLSLRALTAELRDAPDFDEEAENEINEDNENEDELLKYVRAARAPSLKLLLSRVSFRFAAWALLGCSG